MTEPTTERPSQTPEQRPERRRLKRSTRIALTVVLVVAVAIAGAITASYLINSRNYVTTDNAQIDGDKIAITAPNSGYLIDWHVRQGSEVQEDEVVGRIRIDGGFFEPQVSIRAPADATVVIDNGVPGEYVTAGTQLATAYDFSRLYVTARVDETDINDLHPGQLVDVSVDAFPGVALAGRVVEIQGAAAGVFSLFPQANTSGNFQKVTQVIPVKIALSTPGSLSLVPGMSVAVKIHKAGEGTR